MTIPRDLRSLLGTVAGDIDIFLEKSPDAFGALLFRADRDQVEQIVSIEDAVGSIEAEERVIEFADPEEVRVYELPFDSQVTMDDEGTGGTGFADQPVAMLISAKNIPRASVVVYDEYDDLSDDTTRKILYIERSESVSKKPGAGIVYFLLPFFDFDQKLVS